VATSRVPTEAEYRRIRRWQELIKQLCERLDCPQNQLIPKLDKVLAKQEKLRQQVKLLKEKE